METYKSKSICIGVLLEIFRQVPARHPLRDKLEGGYSDAEEGQDVWVCQAFPHHGLVTERLDVVSDGER